jgi:hypothetical protein
MVGCPPKNTSQGSTVAQNTRQILPTKADKAYLNKILHLRNGKCAGCEKSTVLFHGKRYCDECVAKWEAAQRYGGICFENSNPKKENPRAYQLAKAWKPLTSNVYICGHIGTGKSYLAECMGYKAARAHGLGVDRLTANRFCDAVSVRFNSRGSGGLDALGRIQVLILDDIDKAPWNSVSLTWLWEILDTRRTKQRSTIFTSNYAIEQMQQHLEQFNSKNPALIKAILDRFRPYLEIVLTGDSLRKKEDTLQEAAGVEQLQLYEAE